MQDSVIKNRLPDSPIQEFNNDASMMAALLSGYIDYFLMGDDGLEHLLSESDQLDYVEEPMEKLEVGAMFPQAALRQLPVYRGEIISLLKNTSIVGYIAIQDLTKMSDIIRSRTYEAFFPLIVTAVIYFILAWVISLLLRLVLKQIDPRGRKRTVKGVTTN